jgi:hypothetical protein
MVQRYGHYRPERTVDAAARMLAARAAADDRPQTFPRPITGVPRNA